MCEESNENRQHISSTSFLLELIHMSTAKENQGRGIDTWNDSDACFLENGDKDGALR